MYDDKEFAMTAAKEIVVSALNDNPNVVPCKEVGENIAEMFEAIYKKVMSLTA
jgi:hypothetical protein